MWRPPPPPPPPPVLYYCVFLWSSSIIEQRRTAPEIRVLSLRSFLIVSACRRCVVCRRMFLWSHCHVQRFQRICLIAPDAGGKQKVVFTARWFACRLDCVTCNHYLARWSHERWSLGRWVQVGPNNNNSNFINNPNRNSFTETLFAAWLMWKSPDCFFFFCHTGSYSHQIFQKKTTPSFLRTHCRCICYTWLM